MTEANNFNKIFIINLFKRLKILKKQICNNNNNYNSSSKLILNINKKRIKKNISIVKKRKLTRPNTSWIKNK